MTQTRQIIEIDEELCDGCGQCVPACEEGTIQVIDGKARLVMEKTRFFIAYVDSRNRQPHVETSTS